MTFQELLVYFNESKTIGENKEAVDMMRHYSREAQKITMQINRCGFPERVIFTLDSKGELIGPKTIRDSLLH